MWSWLQGCNYRINGACTETRLHHANVVGLCRWAGVAYTLFPAQGPDRVGLFSLSYVFVRRQHAKETKQNQNWSATKRRDGRAGRRKQALEQETNEGAHVGDNRKPTNIGQQLNASRKRQSAPTQAANGYTPTSLPERLGHRVGQDKTVSSDENSRQTRNIYP